MKYLALRRGDSKNVSDDNDVWDDNDSNNVCDDNDSHDMAVWRLICRERERSVLLHNAKAYIDN